MQSWKDVTKEVVTEKRCTAHICDGCGKAAEFPEHQNFVWGGAGTASGFLNWSHTIDGDYESKHLDLCYDCCEKLSYFIFQGGCKRLPTP